MNYRQLLLGAVAACAAFPAFADEDAAPAQSPLIDAIVNGTPIIDVRYRYEYKDQDGFAEEAKAHTIRGRLGYETGDFYGLKVLVEFEGVTSIGDDDFNSTTNGRTMFPVIADPDEAELNRAQISFTGIENTKVIVGRQRINIGNQRYVGAVGWRQNEQTFDAVRATITPAENVTVDYAYIDRVHRVFGDDHPLGEFDSDSHAVTATYESDQFGKLTGYAFFLDLDEAPALSSRTWGVRWENSFTLNEDSGLSLGLVGEIATQSDHGSNPVSYDETYALVEAALMAGDFTGRVGWEQLGGDGVSAFTTPLATLHKFQGFADVFLATPAAGIEDLYVGGAYKLNGEILPRPLNLFVTYHDFQSATGSIDYGSEVDFGASMKFNDNWSAGLKAALFDGDTAGPADRDLFWAYLTYAY